MAGRPKTKAKLDALAQDAEAARAELATYRARLIAAGIDPDTLQPKDTSQEPGFTLEDYEPSLPDKVIALAEEGQDIAEIRISLKFTAIQENQWKDRYVRFAAALARTHEMNHAYWLRQYRATVAGGDRSQANAILALIDKRFMSGGGRGDAAKLVMVKSGPKRQAAQPAMVAAE
jgi:hypothetical protein